MYIMDTNGSNTTTTVLDSLAILHQLRVSYTTGSGGEREMYPRNTCLHYNAIIPSLRATREFNAGRGLWMHETQFSALDCNQASRI